MAFGDTNYLHNKVIEILENEPRVKLLDLGTGGGGLAKWANDKGFEVTALDIDEERFQYKDEINFRKGDITQGLPFEDMSFDYVIMLEVIEHVENPHLVVQEISRVLKSRGRLILSTPNIMNLKSRLRFLFEGAFEFFREPLIEQAKKDPVFGLHVFPWRYQELEYLLLKNNLEINNIYTDLFLPAARRLSFLIPLIRLQSFSKRKRSLKKGGPDYLHLHKVLLSPELLYGRHLIIRARKK